MLWQLGTIIGAPVGIALVACISIPAMIIGIPSWVGRKIHDHYKNANKHKRNLAVVGGVIASLTLSPALVRSIEVPSQYEQLARLVSHYLANFKNDYLPSFLTNCQIPAKNVTAQFESYNTSVFYLQCLIESYNQNWGSGCNAVGRAVASDTRCLWFESSHWQTFIFNICLLSSVSKGRK